MGTLHREFNLENAAPAIRRLVSLRNAKIAKYQQLQSRASAGPSQGVPGASDRIVAPPSATSSNGQGAARDGTQGIDLECRVGESVSLKSLAREIRGFDNQLEQYARQLEEYRYKQVSNRKVLQKGSFKYGLPEVRSLIETSGRIASNDVRLSERLLRLIKNSVGQIGSELYRTAPPPYETANKLYSDQFPEELRSDTSGRGDYVDETLAMLAAYTHEDSDDHSERPAPGLGDPTDRSDISLTDKLYLGRAYTQYEPHQEKPMLLPLAHGHLRSSGYSLTDPGGRYTLFPRNPY